MSDLNNQNNAQTLNEQMYYDLKREMGEIKQVLAIIKNQDVLQLLEQTKLNNNLMIMNSSFFPDEIKSKAQAEVQQYIENKQHEMALANQFK